MPAIQLLPPPDAPTQATTSPNTDGAKSGGGATPGGNTKFGNVLSGTIDSAPVGAPPSPATPIAGPAPPAAANAKPASPPVAARSANSPEVAASTSDAQSLLAAALAASTAVQIEKSKSSNPAVTAPANAGPPAPPPAAIPGAPPAKLASSLSPPNTDKNNAQSTSAASAPPPDQSNAGAATNVQTVSAPPALIAALSQVASLAASQPAPAASPKSLPQPAATNVATAPVQNAGSSVDAGATPVNVEPTITPTAVATAIAATTSASVVETPPPETAPPSNQTTPLNATPSPKSSVAIEATNAASALVTAISSTIQLTGASGSGGQVSLSPQPAQQADTKTLPAAVNNPPPADAGGPAAVAAVATPASITLPSIPVPSAPVGQASVGGPLTQQSVVPADATFTAAGAPNAGHADQQSSSSDADPSTQQSNSYNGGYSIFAAAPPSLQAIAPGYGGAQQASSEQLNAAQVIAQVAYALQVTHQSGQQMQLLLNPPDLGSLQVNVTMHDGVLSARLETQTPATQQILVDNLSQLKDSLNQQGVAFDRIDVRLAGSSSGTGGWGSPDPSFGGQQEGALPYDQAQSFAQTENDDPVISRPSPNGSGLRTALTSLDVKV